MHKGFYNIHMYVYTNSWMDNCVVHQEFRANVSCQSVEGSLSSAWLHMCTMSMSVCGRNWHKKDLFCLSHCNWEGSESSVSRRKHGESDSVSERWVYSMIFWIQNIKSVHDSKSNVQKKSLLVWDLFECSTHFSRHPCNYEERVLYSSRRRRSECFFIFT